MPGAPVNGPLASAVQAIKQSVAKKLIGDREHFWQEMYYDFNVWSLAKIDEKLEYIHRNPLVRGLVDHPEDWRWSSFRNYLTGEMGIVDVESPWTVYRKEHAARAGIPTPPCGSLREP